MLWIVPSLWSWLFGDSITQRRILYSTENYYALYIDLCDGLSKVPVVDGT